MGLYSSNFKILSLFLSDNILRLGQSITINIPAGEEFQAEVQIDESQLKEGEFRKAMRMMTNDPQNMRVFIRIMGNIE